MVMHARVGSGVVGAAQQHPGVAGRWVGRVDQGTEARGVLFEQEGTLGADLDGEARVESAAQPRLARAPEAVAGRSVPRSSPPGSTEPPRAVRRALRSRRSQPDLCHCHGGRLTMLADGRLEGIARRAARTEASARRRARTRRCAPGRRTDGEGC